MSGRALSNAGDRVELLERNEPLALPCTHCMEIHSLAKKRHLSDCASRRLTDIRSPYPRPPGSVTYLWKLRAARWDRSGSDTNRSFPAYATQPVAHPPRL